MEFHLPVLWNFHFLLFEQNLASPKNFFFIIFPVSCSMGNKKIFCQKYWITGFVFMLDAIDSKNWF